MDIFRKTVPLTIAGLLAAAALVTGLFWLFDPVRGDVDVKPYLFVLAALPVLYATVQGFVRQTRAHALPHPRSAEGGWFEIRPKDSRRDRALVGSALALVWNFFSVPATLHYLFNEETRRGSVGVLLVLVLAGIGLAAAAVAGYHLVSLLRMEDARLLIPGRKVFLGQELTLRILQKTAADIRVDRVRVGVTCTPRKPPAGAPAGAALTPVFQLWKESEMNRDVKQGERVRVEHKLTLPPHAPPTMPGINVGCVHDWSVWLITKLAQGANYEAEFPLLVEPRPREEP
jgi:hypothetical protein